MTQQEPNLSKLCHIELTNFKAFGNKVEFKLRPITLIFGQNSGGKSSIVHSLLFLHQLRILRQGSKPHDISFTSLGGSSVDLGGYPHYLYQHNPGNTLKMKLSFERQRYDSRFGNYYSEPSSTEITLKQTVEKDMTIQHVLTSVQLFEEALYNQSIDLNRLSRHESSASISRIEVHQFFIEHLHPVFEEIVNTIEHKLIHTLSLHEQSSNELRSVLQDFRSKHLNSFAEKVIEQVNEQLEFHLAQSEVRQQLENILNAQQHESVHHNTAMRIATVFDKVVRSKQSFSIVLNLLNDTKNFDDSLQKYSSKDVYIRLTNTDYFWDHVKDTGYQYRDAFAVDTFQAQLHDATCDDFLINLRYLGPLRKIPNRFFNEPEIGTVSESDGSTAWELLALYPTILQVINTKLRELNMNYTLQSNATSDTYTVQKHVLDDFMNKIATVSSDNQELIANFVKELQNTRIGPKNRLYVELLDLRSDTVVSHRDVGVGFSQVLPILVNCYSGKNATVCIEQPELHLHPRLQGDLADVFIQTSIGSDQNNSYVIETHSEAIIRRLMRRVREGVISKDDISIVYVEQIGQGSSVSQIEIDNEGDLVDEWPNGFFEESFRDHIAGRR